MAMIRWNPWNLERLFDEDFDLPTIPGISRLIGQGLNLYETEDAVVAQVPLPGIPEDRIDVTIDENGIVRVTASYDEDQEERSKRRYFMSSLTQSYNYTFRLPHEVKMEEEPVCEFNNGMLNMTFAKMEKQAPKKIRISSKNKKTPETTSSKS